MNITEIKLYKYELPLTCPLTIKGHVINSRSGVIVSIKDDSGFVGLGDAAPLPGLHDENLEDAINELVKIKDAKELSLATLPSVKFAVEAAMLDLSIQNEKLFNSLETLQLPINALIAGDIKDIGEGFSVVKVKVGTGDIQKDIERMQSIKQLGKNITLRLDANRAWTLKDALEFCQNVNPEGIEYIEEPVKNTNDHAEFIKASPIPLALDETLIEKDISQINLNGVKAMVLKPSVLGGFDSTEKLISIAKENNILPVLSSTFESGVGVRSIALFAASMGLANIAAGLDTLKWFAEDVLKEKIKINNGSIDVLKLLNPALRTDILTKLSDLP